MFSWLPWGLLCVVGVVGYALWRQFVYYNTILSDSLNELESLIQARTQRIWELEAEVQRLRESKEAQRGYNVELEETVRRLRNPRRSRAGVRLDLGSDD